MSEYQDVRQIIRREFQLNSLAYLIIAALLALVGLLAWMVIAEIGAPEWWLLDSEVFRSLFTGLLLMVILYMVDQHRRLRSKLLDTHSQLEEANIEIRAAYERLAFAQHAAEVMTSLDEPSPLERVLCESVVHFGAEAAAFVDDDVTLRTVEGVDARAAQQAILRISLDAVRAGKPLLISDTQDGSEALAVPLRIHGELRSVVCLWRRERPFEEEQLEGLGLVARIIELSDENRELLDELHSRLTGTLKTLSALIDGRIPGYVKRSARSAEQAVAVGRTLGMTTRELADLRIAATLIDVGMLDIPESILAARRSLSAEEIALIRLHPEKGAEVARQASFSTAVQDAIRAHHERLDGSGYPRRLRGDQIGLHARILAVCDTYNSMTAKRPHRPALTGERAIGELVAGAGTLYDRRVVGTLMKVLGYSATEHATDTPESDEPLILAGLVRESGLLN